MVVLLKVPTNGLEVTLMSMCNKSINMENAKHLSYLPSHMLGELYTPSGVNLGSESIIFTISCFEEHTSHYTKQCCSRLKKSISPYDLATKAPLKNHAQQSQPSYHSLTSHHLYQSYSTSSVPRHHDSPRHRPHTPNHAIRTNSWICPVRIPNPIDF